MDHGNNWQPMRRSPSKPHHYTTTLPPLAVVVSMPAVIVARIAPGRLAVTDSSTRIERLSRVTLWERFRSETARSLAVGLVSKALAILRSGW